jgi:hypothetical protein
MTKTNLNPTIDEYQGAIGKLVFKKVRGRVIVAKKSTVTKEPTEAQIAQRIRFKEAAAFGKFAQDDPALSAFYGPIAKAKAVTVYTVAAGDYLRRPVVKSLDLSDYRGRLNDPILIQVTDDIGLVYLQVTLTSHEETVIESGKAVESAPGTGQWTYTTTQQVALGTSIKIDVVGVDHAGNKVRRSDIRKVGEG